MGDVEKRLRIIKFIFGWKRARNDNFSIDQKINLVSFDIK